MNYSDEMSSAQKLEAIRTKVADAEKLVDKNPPTVKNEAAKSDASEARREWKSYYSDMALAERFVAAGIRVLFVPEYGQWMSYEEATGVWVRVHESDIRGRVQGFLKREHDEATKANNVIRLDAADACQRTMTAKRVVEWMTPTLGVKAQAFDNHRDLIVVANGVVDLRTSELLPFDPDLFFTKRIAYPYVAGARHELTDAALASMPIDAHFQFQVMAGQALTGYQPSRSSIFFFWGDGSNGKSTLIDLLSATAGDYGGKPSRDVLLKGGSSSNFHSITFKGLRQAIIEELPDERFLDGGAVRDLAGTTSMVGEHKGKDVEEFEVYFTIFITMNTCPQVSETVHGVWRRLKLFSLPFKYVESKAEVKHPLHRLQNAMLKDLHKKSEDAVIAFLAWRIEGARQWYEADKRDPEDAPSVVKATRTWRSMNDVLAHWFEENLVADTDSFILVDDLLDDLNQWRNAPKTTWGKHNLIDKLTSHSLFNDHGLEYKQAARHSSLRQSQWASDRALRDAQRQIRSEERHTGMKPKLEDILSSSQRIAKAQATFVQGIRFRHELDDLQVPDDASTLLADDEPDELDDEVSF